MLTAIDKIAEAYLDDNAALDPVAATRAGIPGHDHRLPGLDPAWHDERSPGAGTRVLAATLWH